MERTDTVIKELAEISRQFREISRMFRTALSLSQGLSGLGLAVPGLSQAAAGLSLLEMLRAGSPVEITLHQQININIGEGQISERAFWDDLVMRHLIPSMERGGMIPEASGGAG